LLCFL